MADFQERLLVILSLFTIIRECRPVIKFIRNIRGKRRALIKGVTHHRRHANRYRTRDTDPDRRTITSAAVAYSRLYECHKFREVE